MPLRRRAPFVNISPPAAASVCRARLCPRRQHYLDTTDAMRYIYQWLVTHTLYRVGTAVETGPSFLSLTVDLRDPPSREDARELGWLLEREGNGWGRREIRLGVLSLFYCAARPHPPANLVSAPPSVVPCTACLVPRPGGMAARPRFIDRSPPGRKDTHGNAAPPGGRTDGVPVALASNAHGRGAAGPGGVAERLNAPVLKTGVAFGSPWVRIPPPPLMAAAVPAAASKPAGLWATPPCVGRSGAHAGHEAHEKGLRSRGCASLPEVSSR